MFRYEASFRKILFHVKLVFKKKSLELFYQVSKDIFWFGFNYILLDLLEGTKKYVYGNCAISKNCHWAIGLIHVYFALPSAAGPSARLPCYYSRAGFDGAHSVDISLELFLVSFQ